MIKLLLKHMVLETCIDTFFNRVFNNFIRPDFKKTMWGTKLSHERYIYTQSLMFDALCNEIRQEIDTAIIGQLSGIPVHRDRFSNKSDGYQGNGSSDGSIIFSPYPDM